jgi:hypothetical protein
MVAVALDALIKEARRRQRRRQLLIAGAAVVALAAGGGVYLLLSGSGSNPSAPAKAVLAPPGSRPFIRAAGNEGSAGTGDSLGPDGFFAPYRTGAHLSIVFTLQNTEQSPVTLVDAGERELGLRLVRRLGTQFRLVPRSRDADDGFGTPVRIMMRPWRPGPPSPLAVPAGRSVAVQFDFVIGGCGLLEPGTSHTYNRSTDLVYRLHGTLLRSPIDLRGDQVTVTEPSPGACLAGRGGAC